MNLIVPAERMENQNKRILQDNDLIILTSLHAAWVHRDTYDFDSFCVESLLQLLHEQEVGKFGQPCESEWSPLDIKDERY